nr:Gag-Pol polyprotein [Tanacetum cinerariifolium]
MLGSEYGEQDRKAAVLYEYETFKATEGELLLDTYIRYVQVINDSNKCGYSKYNCELNFKFLNNLQPEWKQYATMMRQNKNLMDINIDALYNILKQNQGDVNDAMGSKKKNVVVTSDPLALIAEKTKVSKSKEKVVVSLDSKRSDADDFKASLSSADEKIFEVSYYLSESESESEFETLEYYDNSTNYGLFVNNDDDHEIFHDAIESASENHIDSQKDYYKSDVDHNDSEEKDQLVDKKYFENQNKDLQDKYDVLKNQTTTFEMNNKELNEQLKELIEMNNDLLAQTKVLKEQLQVKHVVIDTHAECQENYAKLEAERNEYIIRYSAYFDNDKQHRKQIVDQEVLKGIGFEKPSYFEKEKDLRSTLYDEKVIGLRYPPMFLTHSDKALEIEKFKRSRKNKIEFAYDYGNLNASHVNEKINLEDDYFQEIINPDFENIDSSFQQTSSLKPYVPNVILEKIIIDLEDEVVNLLEKEKVNLETIEFLKSKSFEPSEKVSSESENQSENDCLVVEKEYDKEENPKVIAPGMF